MLFAQGLLEDHRIAKLHVDLNQDKTAKHEPLITAGMFSEETFALFVVSGLRI